MVLAKGEEICTIAGLADRFLASGAVELSEKTFAQRYKLYQGEDLSGKTLCVWRTGGIGDILWIRPILCHLKDKYPTCQILFSTRSRYHEFIQWWTDCVDGLSNMPMPTRTTIDVADYHISFQSLIEVVDECKKTDIHDIFARFICLDPDEIEWSRPMPLPPIDSSSTLGKVTKYGAYGLVQYRTSAQIRSPIWSIIIAAINALTDAGLSVVVADRMFKAREIDHLKSCCKYPDMIFNYALYRENLLDTVQLVTHAKLVIAPDSSQMHMAAMQGIPSVGLYGPFPAAIRCSRYPKAVTIEPEPSKVCLYGGRDCQIHQEHACDHNVHCWRYLDTNKLTNLINQQIKTHTRETDHDHKYEHVRPTADHRDLHEATCSDEKEDN
jgi:ADP-heptose:LPS heptosyltransferase